MKAIPALLWLLALVVVPHAALAVSIQQAKQLGDTEQVVLMGKTVTHAEPGFFYIEEDSRAIGIRVEISGHNLSGGMRADVSGSLSTRPDTNERYILATTAVESPPPGNTGAVEPMMIRTLDLGGTDWSVAGTGGQQGTSGSRGLNNVGLLVRVSGRYSRIDSTTFAVADGSGPPVRCTVPAGTFLSPAWEFVTVTGVSSIYHPDASYRPLLLARDIEVTLPVEAVGTPGVPTGEATPLLRLAYGYITTGSTCSHGHPVEYSFDWGDGTSSPWSTSTTATHAWSTAGTRTITVWARCQAHPAFAASASRVVAPAAALASAPWPYFRHDASRSGLSPAHDATPSGTVWTRTVGDGYGSPAIGADGTIYILGANALYALNCDGTVKWTAPVTSPTRSTPAIAPDGSIYVGANGRIYAFNSNGSSRWSYVVGGNVTGSAILDSSGSVYIGCQDGYFYALDSAGTLKWRYSTGAIDISSPALSADETVVYIGGGTGLYALYTVDGSLKWRNGLSATGHKMTCSPALSPDGGTVYIGTYSGNAYAVDTFTGVTDWSVYVGYSSGNTGASPAVGSDGTIYLGSNYGPVYAIRPDGTEKWVFQTESDVRGSIALNADGTVIVASWDGYVRGIDSSTGTRKWNYVVNTGGANLYSSPAVAANGTVVFCLTNGVVYGNIGWSVPGPIAPGNLTAVLASDTSATLNWQDKSTDEYGFRIQRRIGTTGSYATIAKVGAGVTTYTDPVLSSGQVYYYRVCAYQSGGDSAFTNEAWVTTPGPAVPTGLTATPGAAGPVDLSWDCSDVNVVFSSLERSEGPNGLFEEIAQVPAGVHSASDPDTYPGRDYYYRVRAWDGEGYSGYSNTAWAAYGKTYPEVVRGNTSRKQMALTFDGGSAEIKSVTLDALHSEGLFCTFFITGYVAQVQSDLVRRIADEGHEVCNHTYNHPNLTTLADSEILYQLDVTDDILYDICGMRTRSLFRAPGGARDQRVLSVTAADGYQHVYWTKACDSETATETQVYNNAVAGASNGAVLLFHCTYPGTAAAMPAIIAYVRSQGYDMVTVPELIAPKQVTSPSLSAGWNLISLPIDPALDFPHIVFRGLPLAGNLKRWDRSTASEVTYTSLTGGFGGIYADQGYWLYVSAPTTFKFNGASATTDRKIKLQYTTSPDLATYGLIGYPFETAQSFGNCLVYNPNASAPQTRGVAEAISLGWVPDRVWSWNAATQSYTDVGLPGSGAASSTLEPWRGYKAASLTPGVQFIIPKP